MEEPAGLAVMGLVGAVSLADLATAADAWWQGWMCAITARTCWVASGDEASGRFAGDAAALPRRAEDPRDLG